MAKTLDVLTEEIVALPDLENLRLLDAILTDLDKADPDIKRVWAEEAPKRWAAYKAGKIATVSYESIREKRGRSC